MYLFSYVCYTFNKIEYLYVYFKWILCKIIMDPYNDPVRKTSFTRSDTAAC